MKEGLGASGCFLFLLEDEYIHYIGLLEWQRTEIVLNGGIALYKCRKYYYILFFSLLEKASGISSTSFSKVWNSE